MSSLVDDPDVDLTELATGSNAGLAEGIRGQAPIWVDPALVDLDARWRPGLLLRR